MIRGKGRGQERKEGKEIEREVYFIPVDQGLRKGKEGEDLDHGSQLLGDHLLVLHRRSFKQVYHKN